MTVRRKEAKETVEDNLSKGKIFMQENAKREGVISLPSGLQYKVRKEGSGRAPKATDEVTVNYRGTFIDGNEFDSSYSRGAPFTFEIDNVIPGWKEALQLMKEGARWELFVPPDLGYGDRGGSTIPPGSTLIFEVELLAVK